MDKEKEVRLSIGTRVGVREWAVGLAFSYSRSPSEEDTDSIVKTARILEKYVTKGLIN